MSWTWLLILSLPAVLTFQFPLYFMSFREVEGHLRPLDTLSTCLDDEHYFYVSCVNKMSCFYVKTHFSKSQ